MFEETICRCYAEELVHYLGLRAARVLTRKLLECCQNCSYKALSKEREREKIQITEEEKEKKKSEKEGGKFV